MPGKEYECRECGRTFLVDEEKKRELKCPSCEGGNVAVKQERPLPQWILAMNEKASS
jgi:DNA-directed RNA polymerase subunit RPC12/RpoP